MANKTNRIIITAFLFTFPLLCFAATENSSVSIIYKDSTPLTYLFPGEQFDDGEVTIKNNSSATITNLQAKIISAPEVNLEIMAEKSSCTSTLAADATCDYKFKYSSKANLNTENLSAPSISNAVSQINISYTDPEGYANISYPIQTFLPTHNWFLTLSYDITGYNTLDSTVNRLFKYKNDFYVATQNGLAISHDDGISWTYAKRYNGLPINVHDVQVASDGTIYAAATDDESHNFSGGLAISHDGGISFIIKTTADGLVSNYVQSVYLDKDDNIYVGTKDGLSISKDKGNTFINKTRSDGLGTKCVQNVYVDKIGNIYAMTSDNEGFASGLPGLSISKDGGKTFVHRTTTNGLGSNNVAEVAVDSKGIIYAATRSKSYDKETGGLSISSDGGNSFCNQIWGSDNDFLGVVVDSKDNVYATFRGSYSNTGLISSNDGGKNFTPLCSWKSSGYIRSERPLYLDMDDYLYLNIYNFISDKIPASYLISRDSGNHFEQKFSFSTNIKNINKVFVDNAGVIYAATESDGLAISHDNGRSFTYKTFTDSSYENQVYDVSVDKNGVIYVGINSSTGQQYPFYKHGGLAISTDGGRTFTTKIIGPNNDSIGTIYIDQEGTIYISGHYGHAFVSRDGAKTFEKLNLPSGVSQFATDDLNNLYCATFYGLAISTDGGKSFTFKTKSDGLPSDLGVTTVYIDNDNTIYLGFHGSILDPYSPMFAISTDRGKTFEVYTPNDGIPSGNEITGSFVDKFGTVYVTADYGRLSIKTKDSKKFTAIDLPETPKGLTGLFYDKNSGRLYLTGHTLHFTKLQQ